MCLNLIGLTKGCGSKNPAGLRTKMLLIPANELTNHPRTLKQMTPASTTPGASVLLNEEFEYTAASGKGYWRSVDILIDKNSLTWGVEGEKGNFSIKNGAAFSVVGTDIEQREFVEMYVNCCHVALFQTRADDTHYQVIGRYDDPALIEELDGTTGAQVSEFNGFNFKISDSTGLITRSYPVALGVNLTPNV